MIFGNIENAALVYLRMKGTWGTRKEEVTNLIEIYRFSHRRAKVIVQEAVKRGYIKLTETQKKGQGIWVQLQNGNRHVYNPKNFTSAYLQKVIDEYLNNDKQQGIAVLKKRQTGKSFATAQSMAEWEHKQKMAQEYGEIFHENLEREIKLFSPQIVIKTGQSGMDLLWDKGLIQELNDYVSK